MPQHQYKVGDLVRFPLGMRPVQGIIKEDRGPIGVNGRRLYRVEFRRESESESDPPSQIELPAEEMEFIEHTVPAEQ